MYRRHVITYRYVAPAHWNTSYRRQMYESGVQGILIYPRICVRVCVCETRIGRPRADTRRGQDILVMRIWLYDHRTLSLSLSLFLFTPIPPPDGFNRNWAWSFLMSPLSTLRRWQTVYLFVHLPLDILQSIHNLGLFVKIVRTTRRLTLFVITLT